jgi:hypothetical protein
MCSWIYFFWIQCSWLFLFRCWFPLLLMLNSVLVTTVFLDVELWDLVCRLYLVLWLVMHCRGPKEIVVKYKMYVVNGKLFRTLAHDVWMRTQNSSVCVISFELFDSRPFNLHLLDLVCVVYITFCCSFVLCLIFKS